MITTDLRVRLPVSDTVTAYHTPISREIYEANFRLLGETKIALIGENIRHAYMASGDATLYLVQCGQEMAAQRGGTGDFGATALLADIKRLTLILAPGPHGWGSVPVDVALASGQITADEWADTEAALVFFTAWMAGVSRKDRVAQLNFSAQLIGGSTTSSSPAELISSLQQQSPTDNSAPNTASLVPS